VAAQVVASRAVLGSTELVSYYLFSFVQFSHYVGNPVARKDTDDVLCCETFRTVLVFVLLYMLQTRV
jgi:hypothetical protein